MLELDRDIKVFRTLTLKELYELQGQGKAPKVIVGAPPFYLNQTLFSWCEWLELNPRISRQERARAFSEDTDYCEWLMFMDVMKNEEVNFYDYLNNIAYIGSEN